MESALHAYKLLEKMKRKPRDFTIKVGNRSFPVHRNLITASSDYFDKMIESGMVEAQEGCVILQGVEENAAEICVNFMYTGEAEITLVNVKGVLHAAHLMQLAPLVEKCVIFLKKNLSPQLCLESVKLGRLYDEKELVIQAESFLMENFTAAISTAGFVEISCADLSRYLKKAPVEHDVKWKAITTWFACNDTNADESLTELARAVQLSKFPLDFLCREVCPNDILQKCQTARNVVLEGLFSDEEMLQNKLKLDNCFTLKDFAERHHIENLESVLAIIAKFMAKNFKSVSEVENCNELDFDEILNLLTSSDTVSSERTKLKAALQWASKKKERMQDFPKLFDTIQLENIPREILQKAIESESLIMESTPCKDHLLKSIFKCKSLATSVRDLLEYASEQPSIFTYDTVSGIVKVIFLNSGCEYLLPRVRPTPGRKEVAYSNNLVNVNEPRDGAIFFLNQKLYISHITGMYVLDQNGRWSNERGRGFRAIRAFEGKIYGNSATYDTNTATWLNGSLSRTEYVAFRKHYYAQITTRYDSTHPYQRDVTLIQKDGKEIYESHLEYGFYVELKESLYNLSPGHSKRYNPITEKWNEASRCISRKAFDFFIMNNKLHVTGGNEDSMHDTIEAYDEESDKWNIVLVTEPSAGYLAACGYSPDADKK